MKRGGVGDARPTEGPSPKWRRRIASSPKRGNSDGRVARRFERGRAADGGVRRRRDGVRRCSAERHSRSQLHARLSRRQAQEPLRRRRSRRKARVPVVSGTEMNTPGQNFVYSLSFPSSAVGGGVSARRLHVYAHSVLQRELGLGYLSAWARRTSPRSRRRRFLCRGGARLAARRRTKLRALDAGASPNNCWKTELKVRDERHSADGTRRQLVGPDKLDLIRPKPSSNRGVVSSSPRSRQSACASPISSFSSSSPITAGNRRSPAVLAPRRWRICRTTFPATRRPFPATRRSSASSSSARASTLQGRRALHRRDRLSLAADRQVQRRLRLQLRGWTAGICAARRAGDHLA